MATMYEDSVFATGKYKGHTVAHVAKVDRNYLRDYQTRTKSNFISDEVMDNLDKYRTTLTKNINQELTQPKLGGFKGTA